MAAIGQTVAGILCFIRGSAYTGYITSTFGLWLLGFYLIATNKQTDPEQLSVGELPVHPLETLHETIIPAHRTQSRQTRQDQRPFSAGS